MRCFRHVQWKLWTTYARVGRSETVIAELLARVTSTPKWSWNHNWTVCWPPKFEIKALLLMLLLLFSFFFCWIILLLPLLIIYLLLLCFYSLDYLKVTIQFQCKSSKCTDSIKTLHGLTSLKFGYLGEVKNVNSGEQIGKS